MLTGLCVATEARIIQLKRARQIQCVSFFFLEWVTKSNDFLYGLSIVCFWAVEFNATEYGLCFKGKGNVGSGVKRLINSLLWSAFLYKLYLFNLIKSNYLFYHFNSLNWQHNKWMELEKCFEHIFQKLTNESYLAKSQNLSTRTCLWWQNIVDDILQWSIYSYLSKRQLYARSIIQHQSSFFLWFFPLNLFL